MLDGDVIFEMIMQGHPDFLLAPLIGIQDIAT